jgi:outer membrane protein
MRTCKAILPALLLAAGCAVPGSDLPSYAPRSSRHDGGAAPGERGKDVPEGVLTLTDCIQLALERNRDIRMADRRILIAQDQTWEAAGNALPSLNVEVTGQARNNDPGSTIGGVSFVTGKKYGAFARASLLVPIYGFGRAENALDSRNAGRDIEALQAGRTRENTALLVSRAYFRVLEAGKIAEVVEESLRVVERQLQVARDFLEQGLVASTDVLTAEVRLAERKQDRLHAQRNLELARATLNRAMGLDVDTVVRIADVAEAEPWNGSYSRVLNYAISNRKDLEAYRRKIEMSQADWKFARSELAPVVYGTLDYNYSTDENLLHKHWLGAGVTVKLPLFDGGSSWARIRQREKDIFQSIDRHDNLADDIALEIKQAYLDVRESAEAIPLAKGAISVAEENLKVTRDQYAEGLVSSADVLEEEDRLATGRSRFYQSLYEYRTRLSALENAAGGPVPAD